MFRPTINAMSATRSRCGTSSTTATWTGCRPEPCSLGVFPIPQFGLGGMPVGFNEEVVRNLIVVDDRQKYAGNQFETIFEFATGSVGHHLLAGFELARFGDAYTFDVALLPNIDFRDAPVETAEEPLFFLPGQSLAGDSRSIVAAPYVIDQIWFADQFQILLGSAARPHRFQGRCQRDQQDRQRGKPDGRGGLRSFGGRVAVRQLLTVVRPTRRPSPGWRTRCRRRAARSKGRRQAAPARRTGKDDLRRLSAGAQEYRHPR